MTTSGHRTSVTCKESSAYSGVSTYTCPGYRLPTEAEWEYAYRAGTTTGYYNGEADKSLCSSSSCLKDANAEKIGWYCGNASSKTHPVGQKSANTWGLFDMAGNVNEWCQDGFKHDHGTSAVIDPYTAGSERVVKGASYYQEARYMRASWRNNAPPGFHYQAFGFRVVRSLPQIKWVTIKAGTFQMGSPSTESCRESGSSKETLHSVTLTTDFEISR